MQKLSDTQNRQWEKIEQLLLEVLETMGQHDATMLERCNIITCCPRSLHKGIQPILTSKTISNNIIQKS